jgi:hypothetical protein
MGATASLEKINASLPRTEAVASDNERATANSAAALAWLNSSFNKTPEEIAEIDEMLAKHVKWLAENPLNRYVEHNPETRTTPAGRKQTELEAAKEEAKTNRFWELEGTFKQKLWAIQIRSQRIKHLIDEKARVAAGSALFAFSSFWIQHRQLDDQAFEMLLLDEIPKRQLDNSLRLIEAASNGRLEKLQRLVHACDVNHQNSEGWTALCAAAVNGHAQCLGQLLRFCDPGLACQMGDPLYLAAKHNHTTDCVELLLPCCSDEQASAALLADPLDQIAERIRLHLSQRESRLIAEHIGESKASMVRTQSI